MKFKDISKPLLEWDDDYTRQDAAYDDFMDGYWKWMHDEVMGSKEFPYVYDVLEHYDIDEDPWLAYDEAVSKAKKVKNGSESVVVEKDNATALAKAVAQGDLETAVKLSLTDDDLDDKYDMKDEYQDGVDYARDPDGYNGVPRPSIR